MFFVCDISRDNLNSNKDVVIVDDDGDDDDEDDSKYTNERVFYEHFEKHQRQKAMQQRKEETEKRGRKKQRKGASILEKFINADLFAPLSPEAEKAIADPSTTLLQPWTPLYILPKCSYRRVAARKTIKEHDDKFLELLESGHLIRLYSNNEISVVSAASSVSSAVSTPTPTATTPGSGEGSTNGGGRGTWQRGRPRRQQQKGASSASSSTTLVEVKMEKGDSDQVMKDEHSNDSGSVEVADSVMHDGGNVDAMVAAAPTASASSLVGMSWKTVRKPRAFRLIKPFTDYFKHVVWTDEEVRIFQVLHSLFGNDWTVISNLLNSKSPKELNSVAASKLSIQLPQLTKSCLICEESIADSESVASCSVCQGQVHHSCCPTAGGSGSSFLKQVFSLQPPALWECDTCKRAVKLSEVSSKPQMLSTAKQSCLFEPMQEAAKDFETTLKDPEDFLDIELHPFLNTPLEKSHNMDVPSYEDLVNCYAAVVHTVVQLATHIRTDTKEPVVIKKKPVVAQNSVKEEKSNASSMPAAKISSTISAATNNRASSSSINNHGASSSASSSSNHTKNNNNNISNNVNNNNTMNYDEEPRWLLGFSPYDFDLTECLSKIRIITYAVSKFANKMKVGHRVYLWETGKSGKLHGTATVIEEAKDIPACKEMRPFFCRQQKRQVKSTPRVTIRIDHVMPKPAAKQCFATDVLLKSHPMVEATGSCIYRLTSEQAARVDGIIFEEDQKNGLIISELYADKGCEVCGSTDNDESMLLCDKCDGGFHLWCTDPPLGSLTEVPDPWYCPNCTGQGAIAGKKHPRPAEEEDDGKYLQTFCQICDKGEDDEATLLCDDCDEGFHTYCLSPPQLVVPDCSWYCQKCLPKALAEKEELQRRLKEEEDRTQRNGGASSSSSSCNNSNNGIVGECSGSGNSSSSSSSSNDMNVRYLDGPLRGLSPQQVSLATTFVKSELRAQCKMACQLAAISYCNQYYRFMIEDKNLSTASIAKKMAAKANAISRYKTTAVDALLHVWQHQSNPFSQQH